MLLYTLPRANSPSIRLRIWFRAPYSFLGLLMPSWTLSHPGPPSLVFMIHHLRPLIVVFSFISSTFARVAHLLPFSFLSYYQGYFVFTISNEGALYYPSSHNITCINPKNSPSSPPYPSLTLSFPPSHLYSVASSVHHLSLILGLYLLWLRLRTLFTISSYHPMLLSPTSRFVTCDYALCTCDRV